MLVTLDRPDNLPPILVSSEDGPSIEARMRPLKLRAHVYGRHHSRRLVRYFEVIDYDVASQPGRNPDSANNGRACRGIVGRKLRSAT